jgi:hypothetical protein
MTFSGQTNQSNPIGFMCIRAVPIGGRLCGFDAAKIIVGNCNTDIHSCIEQAGQRKSEVEENEREATEW